jgi:CheY-like chemotaxis protein
MSATTRAWRDVSRGEATGADDDSPRTFRNLHLGIGAAARFHTSVGTAVLLIGDADERRALSEILSDIGLSVASDGISPAGLGRPSIVLSDIGPYYDSSEVRARVHAIRHLWAGVPVVVLTAHRAAASATDHFGADALVLKPYDLDELLRLVEALLGAPLANSA